MSPVKVNRTNFPIIKEVGYWRYKNIPYIRFYVEAANSNKLIQSEIDYPIQLFQDLSIIASLYQVIYKPSFKEHLPFYYKIAEALNIYLLTGDLILPQA